MVSSPTAILVMPLLLLRMDTLYAGQTSLTLSCTFVDASSFASLTMQTQIQTQMILILLPLKASMTPWILIVYLKRHSGACAGNMYHTRGKRRDGEYLTDITSFNNGQLEVILRNFSYFTLSVQNHGLHEHSCSRREEAEWLSSKHTRVHGCQLCFRG